MSPRSKAPKGGGVVSTLVKRRMAIGSAQGSKFWTIVSAVAVARRIIKRLSGSEPQVLFSHRLEPGQTLIIANQEEGVRVEGAPQGNMEV